MNLTEKKRWFFNVTVWQTVGILLVLLLAAVLLWHGNATSRQAQPAIMAQVYFDGEYRIGDGEWQTIVKGEHIPATKGDVTLRGDFHMLAPDGTYVGVYRGDTPLAFYVNHINLTILEGDKEPYVVDMENPLYGDSACGADWTAYTFLDESVTSIELRIHNPHSYGNETAIDEMLSKTAFWAGADFEKEVLDSGAFQRNVGLLIIIAALVILGTALFTSLIYIKNSKLLWSLGTVVLFAGTYFVYSADGISFWSESTVSNTTLLGCSMMFYMLFFLIALVHFLKATKTVGTLTVVALGAVTGLLFALPVMTDLLFYDTWPYWIAAQTVANLIFAGCLIREAALSDRTNRWLYLGTMLPLASFALDVVMVKLGVWKGGVASRHVFIVFFAVAAVLVLRVIPKGINSIAKAKDLERETAVLNARLADSRISTMMSQIRPHFIYNTLGSIEQLCSLDPPKAGELVHNFAKYLRGNFRELDNPKPILMSQEMEHVHHYVSIEKVRFPDMAFSVEIQSGDFYIPALTIQPLVENAIKHGLMKLPKGGTIHVVSYETDTQYCISVEDDGVGFDTGILIDDRQHVGLRNIRGRLQAMVNGTLEITSIPGKGTRVLVCVPKEENHVCHSGR